MKIGLPPPSVITVIAWLHIFWGVLMFMDPNSIGPAGTPHTTALKTMVDVFGCDKELGSICFASGIAAHVSQRMPLCNPVSIVLLIPQQILTTVSFLDVCYNANGQSFGDKTPAAWSFILRDQLPYFLMAPYNLIATLLLYILSVTRSRDK